MMDNVIKFPIKDDDIVYKLDQDGTIMGVQGKNMSMTITDFGKNFSFGGVYVSREEFLAFFLLTGLLDEIERDIVQDDI